MRSTFMRALPALVMACAVGGSPAQTPDIGNEVQIFLDRFLIDDIVNGEIAIHDPHYEGPVLYFDRPWEGPVSFYPAIVYDGDLYRMYYRAQPSGSHRSPLASLGYAESEDGITWTKPDLGLVSLDGSTDNNLIFSFADPGTHSFAAFYDRNPSASQQARYKAIGIERTEDDTLWVLMAFQSADGREWTLMQEDPVFTDGAFDSLNVAFWSEAEEQYVMYFRSKSGGHTGVRGVSRTTSSDFINWSSPVVMDFLDLDGNPTETEEIYVNQTHPYFRAPSLYVANASRFVVNNPAVPRRTALERGWHPEWPLFMGEGILMSTRPGENVYRRVSPRGYPRPGRGDASWLTRGNFPALNVVPTGPGEMSLYVQKEYSTSNNQIARYSLRVDGFTSIRAGDEVAEVTTQPFTFDPSPNPEEETLATHRGLVSGSQFHSGQALSFDLPSAMELPETSNLGSAATFAFRFSETKRGVNRLLSSFNGSPSARRFYLNAQFSGSANQSPRMVFHYDGTTRTADYTSFPGAPSNRGMHHVALVYANGIVRFYYNGSKITELGSSGGPALNFPLGNLLVGGDYRPGGNLIDSFLGLMDEVVILPRALADTEINSLRLQGAKNALNLQTEQGILLDMEVDENGMLVNHLESGPQGMIPAPIISTGLFLNYSAGARGYVETEILDAAGNPIEGFTFQDSRPARGDYISAPAFWDGGSDLTSLAGQPIRLRFRLKDADLFSFRFGSPSGSEESPPVAGLSRELILAY